MTNPLVSIIIPVYNAEKYLSDCIESLVSVARDAGEILLIDDGSQDQSAEICESYQREYPFVKVLRQANAGPSVARNLGLSVARGEYICFFDSDDYINPESFKRHIDFLEKTKADIWVSDFHRVADNGCILDRVYQIQETKQPIVDKAYLSQFLSAKDCVWNVWRYIFRREFLEMNNLFFAEGFHSAEDLEFVVRALSKAQNFAFFHEPYYFYRVNYGASLTRSYSCARVYQLMTMMRQAAGVLGNSAEDKLLKAKLAREYILNLSLLYEVTTKERKATLNELKAARKLLSGAQGIYFLAAIGVQTVGISLFGKLLYWLKCMKRHSRSIKTKNFAEKRNG